MVRGSLDDQSAGKGRAKPQGFAPTNERRLYSSRRRRIRLLCFGLWLGCVVSPAVRSQQAQPRVALIGFTHPSLRDSAALFDKVENRLKTSLSSDPRVLLADESIVRPA